MRLMSQTWRDIVWCHWPVNPEQVSAILPPGLEPDLYEGSAWVGLVPFSMENLVVATPLAWISSLLRVRNFGEVNVRTYVRGPDGKSGVWFCTLDADSWLAVATARLSFGLPYRLARTAIEHSMNTIHWTCQRRGDHATAEIAVTISAQPPKLAQPGLETFLVERYALYSSWRGRLLRAELKHEPWKVRPGEAVSVGCQTLNAAGLEVTGPPHVLVGEAAFVRVYSPRRV